MNIRHFVPALCAPALACVMLTLPGCVVHEHETVPDRGSAAYAQGYQEGYYDREHHRWWHDHAWEDCAENDVHCPG